MCELLWSKSCVVESVADCSMNESAWYSCCLCVELYIMGICIML